MNRLEYLTLVANLIKAYLTEQLDFHDGKNVLKTIKIVLRRYLMNYNWVLKRAFAVGIVLLIIAVREEGVDSVKY